MSQSLLEVPRPQYDVDASERMSIGSIARLAEPVPGDRQCDLWATLDNS
jgi:hypothetical protein